MNAGVDQDDEDDHAEEPAEEEEEEEEAAVGQAAGEDDDDNDGDDVDQPGTVKRLLIRHRVLEARHKLDNVESAFRIMITQIFYARNLETDP